MSSSFQPMQERVLRLEQYVAGLQSEIQASRNSVVGDETRPQWKFARVDAPPNGDENTFPIVFQDAEYAETIGDNEITYTPRQITSRELCINAAGKSPPYQTVVPVFNIGGQWFTYYAPGTSQPPADGNQSNVIWGTKYYSASTLALTDDGPRTITHIGGTEAPSAVIPTFKYKAGPDIGITLVDDPNYPIRFTQDGIYKVEVSVKVQDARYIDSPGFTEPDPWETTVARVSTYGLSGTGLGDEPMARVIATGRSPTHWHPGESIVGDVDVWRYLVTQRINGLDVLTIQIGQAAYKYLRIYLDSICDTFLYEVNEYGHRWSFPIVVVTKLHNAAI